MLKPETPDMMTEPKVVKKIDASRQFFVVRYSPCGRFLFAGGFDASLYRWEVACDELKPLPVLTGHHGWVTGMVFGPDKKTLYTADSWGQICAWPYEDETPKPLWKVEEAHDGWIRSLDVSRDGKQLATCGRDRMVRVWNAINGDRLHEFAGHPEDVYSVAIHPDGQSVVSGDLKGNVYHWDLGRGQRAREMQIDAMHFYGRIQDVAGLRIMQFHDDGKTLVCAGSEPTKAGRSYGTPTIHLLDWQTLKIAKSLRQGEDKDGYIFDLAWNDGGYFMMATSGTPGTGMLAFRRIDDEEPFFINRKLLNCHSLAVHPNGNRLAVATINPHNQGNGPVFDKSGKYMANWSPLHLIDISPTAAATAD